MTDGPAAPVIRAREVIHRYGDVTALDGLDLEIPPGVTGLVGANGAGKTTLIRILLGLVHPAAGETEVFGFGSSSEAIEVRRRCGYMPEGSCLPNDQTAADFVAYSAELAGVSAKDARRRASETLFLVGLEEERFRWLGDFSTGMRQRVKIAQAIVHDPGLVLLDEPAAGLDPEGRDEMFDIIGRLDRAGINVLISSHVLSDIERTCGWVILLDAGRLIRSGPIDAGAASSTVTVDVLRNPELLADHLRSQGVEVAVEDRRLTVGPGEDDLFDRVRDGAVATASGLLRMARTTRTLEDEFLDRDGAARR